VPLNIARGFCGTGILLFVEPILIPPLIGHPEGVVSREMLPFYTAAIILFIPGKILYRLTVPKKYNIGKQWKIELKK